LALVKALIAENRFHVIATARSKSVPRFFDEGIEESEHVWIRPLDVLIQSERYTVIKEAENQLGGIDVLINNAAYLLRAVVEHVGEIQRFKQMDTNFRGPMAMTKAVLPNMRQRQVGHIINISSVSGMMSMPTMSVYSASKFALEGATEALWYEIRPWRLKASLIQLGFINSDSYKNIKMTRESEKSIKDKNDPYYHHYNSMVPFIERLMRNTNSKPQKIANKIIRLIDSKTPSSKSGYDSRCPLLYLAKMADPLSHLPLAALLLSAESLSLGRLKELSRPHQTSQWLGAPG
jgi:short-subunit dehydrogenase